MTSGELRDELVRAVSKAVQASYTMMDPMVLHEESQVPNEVSGHHGYIMVNPAEDKVSINRGITDEVRDKIQILNWDNNESDLVGDDYTLSSLIEQRSSVQDSFQLVVRDGDGQLKYMSLGELSGFRDTPNFDDHSIGYTDYGDGGYFGKGCYFELKNFGCSSTYGCTFISVIEDETLTRDTHIDVVCRVKESGSCFATVQYLNIDRAISGGGGTETWKNGRFALSKNGDGSYTTKNNYFYVGGLICSMNEQTLTGDGVYAIYLDQNNRTAVIKNYGMNGEESMVEDCTSSIYCYVIPLYTIYGGVVTCDWRIGPAAIMGESSFS